MTGNLNAAMDSVKAAEDEVFLKSGPLDGLYTTQPVTSCH